MRISEGFVSDWYYNVLPKRLIIVLFSVQFLKVYAPHTVTYGETLSGSPLISYHSQTVCLRLLSPTIAGH